MEQLTHNVMHLKSCNIPKFVLHFLAVHILIAKIVTEILAPLILTL